MPPPNDSPIVFPVDCFIAVNADGTFTISPALAALIVAAREGYDWPAGTSPALSQAKVLDLEAVVTGLMTPLTPAKALDIVRKVSSWGSNNKKAQEDIEAATPFHQAKMAEAIVAIGALATLKKGLNALSALPGLRLVMATKVYRFCYPLLGAGAIDRHASYFFNSVPAVSAAGIPLSLTDFRREWSTGKHTKSRLAIFQPNGYNHNLTVFVDKYLIVLEKIATALNVSGVTYTCAATDAVNMWHPADVEMAAYYWWAQNGLA